MLGLAVVGLLAAPLWAEDAGPKATAKAIEAGNPDNVDPNDVKGEKWTLDLQYEPPVPIVVTTPGGDKEVYWYIIYTVTNHSGEDRMYVPAFTLFTDTASVRKAGVYPAVYKAIKNKRKVAFLESPVKLVDKIRVGPDSARTGVAIFAPIDRKTDRFSIFVEGLSGLYLERPKPDAPPPAAPPAAPEPAPAAAPDAAAPAAGAAALPQGPPPSTFELGKPTAKELAEQEKGVMRLRKTLVLEYKLPGDQWWLNLDEPVFVGKRWTWR